MRTSSVMVMLMLVAALTACNNDTGSAANKPAPPTTQQLDERLKTAEGSLALLTSRVNNVRDTPAAVSCVSPGYDTADTLFGSFPVACEKATAYLNGYKLRLRIDNPTTLIFEGVDVKILYGEGYAKSVQATLMDEFLPGHSTYINMTVAPATAAEMNTVFVYLKFDKFKDLR